MDNQRGTVLILVLWVLAMMALMSLSIGVTVRQSVRAAQTFDTREELRQIGESCVKKAMALVNKRPSAMMMPDTLQSPWINDSVDFKDVQIGRGTCSVMYDNPSEKKIKTGNAKKDEPVYGLIDEDRKININRVKSSKILTRFFQRAAFLQEPEAYAIAASVLDWIDEDNHPYDAGAESRYYELLKPPYRPKNAPLATLEEMMLIKGVTPKIFEQVRPYLTVYGGGQVNINTASPLVLESLGLERGLVDKIMRFRMGFDKKTGTRDDGVFSSIQTALADLMALQQLSDSEKALFDTFMRSGNMTTQSSHFLVRSIAGMGTRSERLEQVCVFQRRGPIVSWRELYRTA